VRTRWDIIPAKTEGVSSGNDIYSSSRNTRDFRRGIRAGYIPVFREDHEKLSQIYDN
jgi:hypothetical protein